jgi:hypothetical protein
MILESKHNTEHVSDIRTVACEYWKIAGLNNKRHSEQNREGHTGASGYEYFPPPPPHKRQLYTPRPCDQDKTTEFRATWVHLLLGKYYIFWRCVFSLKYPACNAPYCHLWPVRFYSIFPPYLKNGLIFTERRYWTQNACFDFLYKFCPNNFPH